MMLMRQRNEPPRPLELPPPTDPKVVSFLNDFSALQQQCARLQDVVTQREREVSQYRDRCDLLHNELETVQRQRDEFQRGYFALKAQLAILATSAIAASDQIKNTAEMALAEAKREMENNGVQEVATTETPVTDVDLDSLEQIIKAPQEGKDRL